MPLAAILRELHPQVRERNPLVRGDDDEPLGLQALQDLTHHWVGDPEVGRQFHQARLALLLGQVEDRLDVILRGFVLMRGAGALEALGVGHGPGYPQGVFEVQDWGLVSYQEAWDRQLQVHQSVLDGGPNVLILVEHPPVLTLGANFHESNLLLPVEQYSQHGIEVIRTDRGGDVTYHGPGQQVIYPIFNIGRDVHKWMRDLESTMLEVLASYGLSGRRFPPHTGAWVGDMKVAAIGVKVRRWVSLHGIAINCANDLGAFGLVVPCGIQGYGVTSLSALLGREVTPEEVKPRIIEAFGTVFHGNADEN